MEVVPGAGLSKDRGDVMATPICTRCGTKIATGRDYYTGHIVRHRDSKEQEFCLCPACAAKTLAYMHGDNTLELIINYRRIGIPFELICTLLNVEHQKAANAYAKWLDRMAKMLPKSVTGKIGALHYAGWNTEDIQGDLITPLSKAGLAFNEIGKDLINRIIRQQMIEKREAYLHDS